MEVASTERVSRYAQKVSANQRKLFAVLARRVFSSRRRKTCTARHYRREIPAALRYSRSMDVVRILEALEASGLVGRPLRRKAMELLSEEPGYAWVGVYALHGHELLLDEFVGQATEHTHIPVGKGVCGTAVAENRNMVVDDVRELDNYLACSIDTRSEIVVLIRNQDGKVLGQIDADGHEVGAFNEQDEQALSQIAEFLADRWNELG